MLFLCVFMQPLAWIMDVFQQWIISLNGGSKAIIGAVIGACMGFDMGGPINKTASMAANALGADGIVIGVLTPEGDLDEERMAKLISLAGGCGVTLHRAFDVCRDPFAALETAKRLGVDTILTSGQQADCTAGADLLRALVAKAGEDVQILVGAGVNADVIRDLQPKTGANAFHLSAKRVENSRMQFRRENVPMGLPGLSEFSLWQCDENAVRAAREAFDACCGAGQEART